MVRTYLLTHGEHVEAMRLLAGSHGSKGVRRCRLAARGGPRGRSDYRAARTEYGRGPHSTAQGGRRPQGARRADPGIPRIGFNYQSLYANRLRRAPVSMRGPSTCTRIAQRNSRRCRRPPVPICARQKTLGQRMRAITSYRRAAAARQLWRATGASPISSLPFHS